MAVPTSGEEKSAECPLRRGGLLLLVPAVLTEHGSGCPAAGRRFNQHDNRDLERVYRAVNITFANEALYNEFIKFHDDLDLARALLNTDDANVSPIFTSAEMSTHSVQLNRYWRRRSPGPLLHPPGKASGRE